MSEVRGSGREYQTATAQEGRRGATPRPRSGVADGRRYPMPLSPRPGAMGRRSYSMPPCLRPGAVARRSNPMPKARGGGREDQPHVQGAVAAWVQEGLEELSHIEGQEGVAVRRYPLSKVRSNGCALLEQP